MPDGIIYILINAAMPGYVKLGQTTTSVEQRMKELDTTSTPARALGLQLRDRRVDLLHGVVVGGVVVTAF